MPPPHHNETVWRKTISSHRLVYEVFKCFTGVLFVHRGCWQFWTHQPSCSVLNIPLVAFDDLPEPTKSRKKVAQKGLDSSFLTRNLVVSFKIIYPRHLWMKRQRKKPFGNSILWGGGERLRHTDNTKREWRWRHFMNETNWHIRFIITSY